jgi:hypothetical protein
VFLFYSDHGAAGVLGMPEGPFLYADELQDALRRRAKSGGFREMVMWVARGARGGGGGQGDRASGSLRLGTPTPSHACPTPHRTSNRAILPRPPPTLPNPGPPSYIEACESGSMFEGLLDDRLPIYATTAANAVESSWATYCPSFGDGAPGRADGTANGAANGAGPGHGAGPSGERWAAMAAAAEAGAGGGPGAAARGQSGPLPPPAPEPDWTTCLGDLYSVAWMEDAEAHDMTQETLERQFHLLRLRASNNFSYVQGSHVMRYGDLDMDAELAGDYQG